MTFETAFSPSDRIIRSEDSAGERAPGDYLILDLDSGRYYGVGEAGGFIWEHFDGERELSSIAHAVAEHFGIDTERALADLLELVTSLHELGLVERADPR